MPAKLGLGLSALAGSIKKAVTATFLIKSVASAAASFVVGALFKPKLGDFGFDDNSQRQAQITADFQPPGNISFGVCSSGGTLIGLANLKRDSNSLSYLSATFYLSEGEGKVLHVDLEADPMNLANGTVSSSNPDGTNYLINTGLFDNTSSYLYEGRSFSRTDPWNVDVVGRPRQTAHDRDASKVTVMGYQVRAKSSLISNLPKTIFQYVAGTIYDPRTSTQVRSNNLFLCYYNFLTDKLIGMGLDEDRLDMDKVNFYADIADEKVSLTYLNDGTVFEYESSTSDIDIPYHYSDPFTGHTTTDVRRDGIYKAYSVADVADDYSSKIGDHYVVFASVLVNGISERYKVDVFDIDPVTFEVTHGDNTLYETGGGRFLKFYRLRYECDGICFSDVNRNDVLTWFETACAGQQVETDGKLYLKPKTMSELSVGTLSEDHCTMSVSHNTESYRENASRFKFTPLSIDGRTEELPTLIFDVVKSRDEITSVITESAFTRDEDMALQIQKQTALPLYSLNTIRVLSDFSGYQYERGDIIDVFAPSLRIIDKKYEVTETQILSREEEIQMELVLSEYMPMEDLYFSSGSDFDNLNTFFSDPWHSMKQAPIDEVGKNFTISPSVTSWTKKTFIGTYKTFDYYEYEFDMGVDIPLETINNDETDEFKPIIFYKLSDMVMPEALPIFTTRWNKAVIRSFKSLEGEDIEFSVLCMTLIRSSGVIGYDPDAETTTITINHV